MATAIETSDQNATCRNPQLRYNGCSISVLTSSDGSIWVSAADLCDAIGVQKGSQLVRLKAAHWSHAVREMKAVSPRGQIRHRLMIRLGEVRGWLSSLNDRKVSTDAVGAIGRCSQDFVATISSQLNSQSISATVETEIAKPVPVPTTELALTPAFTLETIPFHGTELHAVRTPRGAFVSIKRICEIFGLDYTTQLKKLREFKWATVGEFPIVAADEKIREQVLVELSCLPKWLGDIEVNKVKPESREKIIQHQRECYEVLARHFGLMPVETTPARMAPEPPARSELELFKADFKVCIEIAELFGYTGNQALLHADKGYYNLKGTSPIRTFGVQLEAPDNEQIQNATDIGIHLGGISGVRVNKLIELAGWHASVPDSKGIPRWILTDAGKKYGTVIDINQKNSDGSARQQTKWKLSVVPILRQLLERQAQPVLFPAASN